MIYLVDTNCAMRRVITNDPDHARIKHSVDTLILSGASLVVTPQILIKFHALATRPVEANGLGLSNLEANEEAKVMETIFPVLEETAAIYSKWRLLLANYDVRGRQAFDARLVAVMLANDVTHILTANASHFRKFTEITVIEPFDI